MSTLHLDQADILIDLAQRKTVSAPSKQSAISDFQWQKWHW